MDGDGDLREQVLHIEAHIEELANLMESCRNGSGWRQDTLRHACQSPQKLQFEHYPVVQRFCGGRGLRDAARAAALSVESSLLGQWSVHRVDPNSSRLGGGHGSDRSVAAMSARQQGRP